MKKLACVLGLSLLAFNSIGYAQEQPVTIAILAPAEIPAMQEIIQGFETELTKTYSGKITFIEKNAQGDMNIQRTLLMQMKNSDAKLIVPIATQPSEMAASIIHDKPIVALAAQMDNKPDNVMGVLDEISVKTQFEFLHKACPEIKKITLVYSPSEKVIPEVHDAELAGAEYGIQIQKLMMTQLSDLYAIGAQVASDSNAIFVFKDAQIVSGMSVLVKQAEKRGIPVIASDDGSVSKGAAFALGVSETQIGVDGAHVVLKVLQGESPKNIPIFLMKEYSVFINKAAAEKQHVDVLNVERVAAAEHYHVVA